MAHSIVNRVSVLGDVLEWRSDVDPQWLKITDSKASELVDLIENGRSEIWLWNDATRSRTLYVFTGWFQGLGRHGHLEFSPKYYGGANVVIRPQATGDKAVTVRASHSGSHVAIDAFSMGGQIVFHRRYPANEKLLAGDLRDNIRGHLMLYHELSPYQKVKLLTDSGMSLSANQILWNPSWLRGRKVIRRSWITQPSAQLRLRQLWR